MRLRMMFVGDSMTIGRAGDYTWRYRMWQHLGDSCEIVGPRTELYESSTAYADPAFPAGARRHLSGWGKGWQHMAPVIRETVAAHRADLLLVSLGLIDLGFYTDAEQTALHARRFLTEAREANPHIRAVLLPVIPNIRAETDAPFAAEVAHFNVLLAKNLADLDEPRSPLLLASRPETYDIHTDTYDGTHPNDSGERKLAGAFADALHQGWGIGPAAGATLRRPGPPPRPRQ
ncbi:GDSL-type esterase/lipase family protein [Streptomyces sp. NPDC090052]|uniref:GDSL-type esterase/lipase family protein n=1 Tax=Streptomyces sp. NPDC090052 TaxID=3365931 RepID=UPI003804CBCD